MSRAGETTAAFHSLSYDPRNQGGMSLRMLILRAEAGGVSVWQGLGAVGPPCLGHCTG